MWGVGFRTGRSRRSISWEGPLNVASGVPFGTWAGVVCRIWGLECWVEVVGFQSGRVKKSVLSQGGLQVKGGVPPGTRGSLGGIW